MKILNFHKIADDKSKERKYFLSLPIADQVTILNNLLIDYKKDYQEKLKNVNQFIFNLKKG